MPRIKRATKSGQPGFTTRSVEGYTGERVSSERAAKKTSGVRILFARNPAKNQTDPLGFTNHARVPNPNAAPNPKIIDGSSGRRLSTLGNSVKRVVNRSTNRSITKR